MKTNYPHDKHFKVDKELFDKLRNFSNKVRIGEAFLMRKYISDGLKRDITELNSGKGA